MSKSGSLAAMLAAATLIVCNFGSPAMASDAAPPISLAQTPLVKGTTTLSLDASKTLPGQFLVADVLSYTGARPAIIAPPGWTLIEDNSSLSTRQALYWHIVKPYEQDSPVWIFSDTVDAQGILLLLDDVDETDPIDASSANVVAPPVATSVKTTSDGDLILAFFATDFAGAAPAPVMPSDMNLVVGPDGDSNQYWILDAYQSRKGDTPDAASSAPPGAAFAAAQLAIKLTAPLAP